MIDSISLFFVAAIVSWILVFSVLRLAKRLGVIDQPNDRSSHTRPTPRGGGLGLLLAMFGALWLGCKPTRGLSTVLEVLAVAIVAAVGWFDDRRGVSVGRRLGVHAAASLLLVPSIVDYGLLAGVPWLLILPAWMLVMVSSINVVNFLDGIDGLIGSQAVVFGVHMALSGNSQESSCFGVTLSGAAIGFLLWNWSPARIFLGDVGSGAIGALFAVGGLIVARSGTHPLEALLPLVPLFLDSGTTIVRRWRRGDRITTAHRSHLYQRLANGVWAHSTVSLVYAAFAAAGTIAAAASERLSSLVPAIAFVLLTVVCGVLLDRRATPFRRS